MSIITPASPRKSPLRIDARQRVALRLPDSGPDGAASPPSRPERATVSGADMRQMAVSEFATWLREQTNKHDGP